MFIRVFCVNLPITSFTLKIYAQLLCFFYIGVQNSEYSNSTTNGSNTYSTYYGTPNMLPISVPTVQMITVSFIKTERLINHFFISVLFFNYEIL